MISSCLLGVDHAQRRNLDIPHIVSVLVVRVSILRFKDFDF